MANATQYKALHKIHRATKPGVAATRDTKAVPPVIQVIQPGTIFIPTDDEIAEMEAAGAIQKVTGSDRVEDPLRLDDGVQTQQPAGRKAAQRQTKAQQAAAGREAQETADREEKEAAARAAADGNSGAGQTGAGNGGVGSVDNTGTTDSDLV
jgi:hypothetical protein